MTIDEQIKVLQDAKAGKTIQCVRKGCDNWDQGMKRGVDGYHDMNFQDYDYRVKPEPREWRVHVKPTGDIEGVKAPDVRSGLFSDRHFDVLVREVL